MILLFILVGLVILFIAYILNSWVSTHAIAILIDGTWTLQHKGWEAMFPPVTAGLLAGLGVGIFLGIGLANKLGEYLQERNNDGIADANAELERQRLALAKASAGVDAQIQKVSGERISAIKKHNEALTLENEQLKRDFLAQKNRADIIEAKLKGAQQKNARLKKHV